MNLPDPKSVKRVTIISTGVIGSSWAAHFLAQGMEVTASNPGPDSEAKTRQYLEEAWPTVERLGTAAGASHKALKWCSDAAEAVDGAQFVQESGPERMDIKASIYEGFEDALGPDAVVATSSSGLLVSDLQKGRKFAERMVVGHPFNPPHLIPVVEVLGGKKTDPKTVDWAIEFFKSQGKKPVRLNHEVNGHLINRLQVAMWREAIDAVATGLASVEDVDTAIAYGPGLRWALNGPHMCLHLSGGAAGMRHTMEHLEPAVETWWADMRPPSEGLDEELKKKIIAGCEAEAAGRTVATIEGLRDELLVTLLLAKSKSKLG
jgi:3-hydroxyacyl-CoA dehydrogenase